VVRRKIIKINESLCTGCGDCIISCAEGAIKLIDGKARVISDNLCDGLGACIGTCPVGALGIEERETEDFDAGLAQAHLGQSRSMKSSVNLREQPTIVPCSSSFMERQYFGPRRHMHKIWAIIINLQLANSDEASSC